MRRRGLVMMLAGLMLAALMAWHAPAARAQAVRVAGSTTVRPFAQAAAEAYRRAHPGAMVLVAGGGSGEGLRRLLAGEADVAMASRPVTQAERKKLAAMGATRRVVGLDGVVVVVSDEVFHAGLHALSRAQIQDIWRGRVTNWKQVGGPDRRILTVGRIAGSGTWGVFTHWLWGDGEHARPMVVMESNRYSRNLLTASDQAIGYLPLGWTNEHVHALALATQDGVIHPTAESIRAGRWPMARKLVLWVRPDASVVARDFAEFMASDAARPLLEQAGYLPLKAPLKP